MSVCARDAKLQMFSCWCVWQVDCNLIATGGVDKHTWLSAKSSATIMDMSSGKWHDLPSMNDERVDHGTCAIGDEIVAGTKLTWSALQIQTC